MIVYKFFKEVSICYKKYITDSTISKRKLRNLSINSSNKYIENSDIIYLYLLNQLDLVNKLTKDKEHLIIPKWTDEITINKLLSKLQDLS